jgi:hypothetical protein
MNPEVIAFLRGYREGREGMTPTASDAMTEQELADLESTNPPLSAREWMFHMMGWTAGQAIALHELAKG